MKSSHEQKNKVLLDHRKVGKRFIPPLLGLETLRETSWIENELPELLWLSLLNKQYGLDKGANLALSLARTVTKIMNPHKKVWFAPISTYATLSEKQKYEVIETLRLTNDLESLQRAFIPLATFYPNCPLNFLFEGKLPNPKCYNRTLKQFKVFLPTLFDKWEKEATFIQANAVYIAFGTDMLRVKRDTSLDNFPAVAEFPKTEESKQVAAGVRALVLAFFGHTFEEIPTSWSRYFWNRGLELEPCYTNKSTEFVSKGVQWEEILTILDNYIEAVRTELSERWGKWSLDLLGRETNEVIGGLLARQVTLATQLTNAPEIWNEHVAPLILRSMADVYITTAWIFGDPLNRAKKFIAHGLGQEKLEIEHLKARLKAADNDVIYNEIIKYREDWLNAHRFTFVTEVNVGSWSGKDTRKMAEEAGCLDVYRSAYTPFSAATHSMWHHIYKYNLVVCQNPLHRLHKIPTDRILPPDIDYVYTAAKYVNKTFKLFDEKTGIKPNSPSALKTLVQALNKLKEKYV